MRARSTLTASSSPTLLGLPLWDGSQGAAQVLPFDAATFTPQAFAAFELECPAAIARSVTKSRAEFFHGRLAARHALAPYGLGHSTIGIGAQREPLWPDGIVGSITHNTGHAAAIALRARDHGGIGIDLDTIADADMSAALAKMVVGGAELAYLRRQAGETPLAALLTMVFSAKESFYKAVFPAVGRFLDFDAVEVQDLDLAQGSLQLRLTQTLGPALQCGSSYRIHVGRFGRCAIYTSCSLPPSAREALRAAK